VTVAEGRSRLDEVYLRACAAISRLEPRDALDAMDHGAVIVDIRSSDARSRDGIVPGSLHIPRTVLEWRVAPDSPWRNPHVGGVERQLLLLCDHGCASALAAATLVELGFRRAGDVVGGFLAWREQGLPLREAPPLPDGLPGMSAPD